MGWLGACKSSSASGGITAKQGKRCLASMSRGSDSHEQVFFSQWEPFLLVLAGYRDRSVTGMSTS